MTNNDFISFFEAMSLLADRLGEKPSEEEFWIWCFWGKDAGGIDAYEGTCRKRGVEPDFRPIPSCAWSGETDISKCANNLICWHFLRSEIESLSPVRYLTAKQLINRWSMPLNGEERATIYIQQHATEWLDYEDARPCLRNCFAGANPGANPEFMPLKGAYLLEDILAVENYCHIEVPQIDLGSNDGVGNHAAIEPDVPKSKLEEQQEAILKVIIDKGFKPMAIPDNEKGTIKSICELEDADTLFKSESAFDRAWKKGIGRLWKMEHHDSYAHRGKD